MKMKETSSLQNLLVRPDGEVEADVPVLSRDSRSLCVSCLQFAWVTWLDFGNTAFSTGVFIVEVTGVLVLS